MASSSAIDPVLPWPECLGNFDEESCRYFLRQLGQRLVQFYPFSVGIEEVYSLIVDEYGPEGTPDALSVLQELLEDDSAAAGIGDDGDIWRSWRHSWRHRNAASRDPCVPRVRGQILPPPTSVRIRLLKNANFMARQADQTRELRQRQPSLRADSPDSQIFSRFSNTSQTYARRSVFPVSNTAVRAERQSLRGQESSSKDRLDARGESDELYLLAAQTYAITDSNTGFSSPPDNQTLWRCALPFNLVSPRRRSSAISERVTRDVWQGVASIPEEEDNSLIVANITSKVESPVVSIVKDISEPTVKQTPSSNRFSLPSELESISGEATPTKRRASHRQARLIDGALFDGKTRKGRSVASTGLATAPEVKHNSKNGAKTLSGHFAAQYKKGGWLRNVWKRFHGEQYRNPTTPKLRKQRSSLTSCGLVGSPPSSQKTASQPAFSTIAEMRQTTPTPRFGFDGACEERLNKPLPLSPGDLKRPSVLSDVHRTFFGRSPKSNLNSPEVTTSPTTQRFFVSGEDNDLSSLVSATMSGPQELSPKEKTWNYRFSDSSLKSGPLSPSSFATFAKRNPYRDSSEHPTPTTPVPPAPLVFEKQNLTSVEWPFKSMQDLRRQNTADETLASNRTASSRSSDVERSNASSIRAVETGHNRGRRPATPNVAIMSQDSRFQVSPPKTPPPRSKSPVKRLIGMVKSMSTNQISDNAESPAQDVTASANKRRWKELSNKLRHGFLTADMEQLEQEEMMEQYATNDNVHILTPPPSRQRAPFPVSIKSSGQNKLWSELEFMLIETCNTFLKDELEHGRLSRESIIRAKRQWQARSRPQVVEFYYDQATQYEIIIGNLRTIKLYSDYAEDAIMLNSVLHQWKILIRELSVKTLCMPDSIVRRWLHDGRRVLELLGAPSISLAHLDRLSGLCFAVFGSAEKQRAKRRSRADTGYSHRRSASDGSQNTLVMHEQALMNHGVSGALQVPPLPTPRSTGDVPRKVTPQEQRIAQQARKSSERERPVFASGGRGHSKSLTTTDKRSRFVID